jgi:general stress protein 26
MVKGIRVAMLTTAEPSGRLRSKPMATQDIGDDGVIWFFTSLDSTAHDPGVHNVNVSYADSGKQTYVSVSGRATVVRDAAMMRKLFTPAVKAWFPKGLDDERLALLRVDPQDAEYWDGDLNSIVTLFKMAAAIATGTQADIGDHGKASLS